MAHFLTVSDVLTRYQLRDRRSSRHVMDQAGSFKVGGRLLVSEPDLEAWEAQQKARRNAQTATAGDAKPTRARANRARTAEQLRSEPLPPEWWRERA